MRPTKSTLRQIVEDMDKLKPETTGEALGYWHQSKKGNTPSGLVYLWKALNMVHHPESFVVAPPIKLMGQLGHVCKDLGEHAAEGMVAALENWSGFIAFCESEGEAWDSPKRPSLQYWIRFAHLSVTFAGQLYKAEEDDSEDWTTWKLKGQD